MFVVSHARLVPVTFVSARRRSRHSATRATLCLVALGADGNDGNSVVSSKQSAATRRAVLIAGTAAFTSSPRPARALDTYSGVGLEVFVDPAGSVKVVEAFGAGYAKQQGPAWDAGIRLNDSILEVDGKSPTTLGGLAGFADALRGSTGSTVCVKIERKVKRERVVDVVEITRGEVEPSARSCFVSTCKRV